MKIRPAALICMICLIALLLGGCGYFLVEEAPVQVGSAVIREE